MTPGLRRLAPIQFAPIQSVFRLSLICILATFSSTAFAQDAAPVDATEVAFDAATLKGKTDQELTQITAQWGALSAAERRVLLAEVRQRMADRRRAELSSAVRTRNSSMLTRRYGRILRKPDGSVVVQTTVIEPNGKTVQQTHQTQQAQSGSRRITFGFGFERRARRQAVEETVQQMPGGNAVTISNEQPQASPDESTAKSMAETDSQR